MDTGSLDTESSLDITDTSSTSVATGGGDDGRVLESSPDGDSTDENPELGDCAKPDEITASMTASMELPLAWVTPPSGGGFEGTMGTPVPADGARDEGGLTSSDELESRFDRARDPFPGRISSPSSLAGA